MPDDGCLTQNEVARLLRVRRETIWKWCTKGANGRVLASVKAGSRRLIHRNALEAFLRYEGVPHETEIDRQERERQEAQEAPDASKNGRGVRRLSTLGREWSQWAHFVRFRSPLWDRGAILTIRGQTHAIWC